MLVHFEITVLNTTYMPYDPVNTLNGPWTPWPTRMDGPERLSEDMTFHIELVRPQSQTNTDESIITYPYNLKIY